MPLHNFLQFFKRKKKSVVDELAIQASKFFGDLQTHFLDRENNILKDTFSLAKRPDQDDSNGSAILERIEQELESIRPYYPVSDLNAVKLSKMDRINIESYCHFVTTLSEVLSKMLEGVETLSIAEEPEIIQLSLNLTVQITTEEDKVLLRIGLLDNNQSIIKGLEDAFCVSSDAYEPVAEDVGFIADDASDAPSHKKQIQ